MYYIFIIERKNNVNYVKRRLLKAVITKWLEAQYNLIDRYIINANEYKIRSANKPNSYVIKHTTSKSTSYPT